jgi:hypothetical protein
MKRGRIEEAKPQDGTRWERPINLYRWSLSGWRFVSRHKTRAAARAVAKRLGLTLEH